MYVSESIRTEQRTLGKENVGYFFIKEVYKGEEFTLQFENRVFTAKCCGKIYQLYRRETNIHIAYVFEPQIPLEELCYE